MKSHEITREFLKVEELTRGFIRGDLEQSDFCGRIETIAIPLIESSERGARGIMRSYPSTKEGVKALIHEALHIFVNRVYRIPSAGIGAIKKEDSNLVWGLTLMDTDTATKIPNLRTKLKKAQRLHEQIEKLNI